VADGNAMACGGKAVEALNEVDAGVDMTPEFTNPSRKRRSRAEQTSTIP
jgi:hypothetical protein